MTESFAQLFEESLKELEMAPGSIVSGTVVAIENDFVIVNAGLKSEGVIPVEQFRDEKGQLGIKVGDVVKVALEALEDGFGTTLLSREKAKRAESWQVLEKAFTEQETVTGYIIGKVRGGLTVDINGINAFLPGSLVDVRPLRDTAHLEGQELEFKLVKLDAPTNNIVVSRRAVLEESYSEERQKLLEKMEEGIVVKGVVKNLTDYGAFIELGGIDGLLHITDMAWKRVKHPSELLSVGQEIDVKVLKFDKERSRVSLGLKQLQADPWEQLIGNHKVGDKLKAKVTNLTDYGCFAELDQGVEGLVHVSEMDWTNRNIHPSKVVQVGDIIDVMLLDIDQQRRRISLGMKQCSENPWQQFASTFNKGDRLSGQIKSITDFGIFVGLEGNIDGLVHMSDLSWDEPGEEAVKRFSKGQQVETVVLSVDPERERIALGIKQVDSDPFAEYAESHPKGTVVKGSVVSVDERQALVGLAEGVEGILKVSEISKDRVDNLPALYPVGTEIEAAIISVDRRNRTLNLSVKQLSDQEEKQAIKSVQEQVVPEAAGPTTIGDLIKAQMKKNTK
ncbi:30S ribosomal protein S1 [Nitrincola nitratireducens]|uniref:Small ribosomal subunit protein bS1 n=1 Tax=Nitrincola nitratireducens TaxID=1229521 RepID=W9UX54_9GAMM|nr:30S ribosomal protein S1 [Nitrincola nitratireducens]EXJ11664.1 30S ribosomal protein S1 [Nitrincola nitratireducens]